MSVFLSTLNQMAFLVLLIVIGYILSRAKLVPEGAAGLLSKLENYVFIPALVLGTFMENFTLNRFGVAGQYLLCGGVVIAVTIPIAIVLARLCSKDGFIRNIYTYGLSFSNFGFMGNAVVAALFPDIFMEYLIFVLPFWVCIYVWGVPYLLMPRAEKSGGLSGLKNLINPMFIAMLVGMAVGLANLPVPAFLSSAVGSLGNCMSPIAMLLTGMTIARINLKSALTNLSIYAVSALRLVVIPVAAIVALRFLPISYGLALCTVCSLAMPLGLNTIVVPNAYGRDTTVAAGMALISHLLSCLSIPLVFMLFDVLCK